MPFLLLSAALDVRMHLVLAVTYMLPKPFFALSKHAPHASHIAMNSSLSTSTISPAKDFVFGEVMRSSNFDIAGESQDVPARSSLRRTVGNTPAAPAEGMAISGSQKLKKSASLIGSKP